MFTKKILLAWVVAMLAVSSASAAYSEIDCSSDPVFQENSCNQCFNWGEINENVGFLSDKWVNKGTTKQLLYKEQQKNPSIKGLNWATWSQTVSDTKFWKFTQEMEAIKSEEDSGYVLEAGKSITWLESNIDAAYSLEKNTAAKWENIGLLVYPIKTHTIDADGIPSDAATEHNECVLFKSVWAAATPSKATPNKATPKKLPKTGPESILLLLFAMILGFVVLRFTKKA